MPHALIWTGQRDDTLRALRAHGRSWDSVAAALGISRWAAIERAKLLGAHAPLPPRAPRPAAEPDRGPLPAGHPLAWSVLVAGTVLEGTAYPSFPPAWAEDADDADEAAPALRLDRAA